MAEQNLTKFNTPLDWRVTFFRTPTFRSSSFHNILPIATAPQIQRVLRWHCAL